MTALWRPCAALLALLLSASGCVEREPISVSDARIRELIADRTTTAAYFTVHNHSGELLTLTGAESSRASSIEIHTMVSDGDRVGMRRLREVVIEPGSSIAFAQGGLHLMVFGVENLEAPFPITLIFANGTRVPVAFTILSLTTGG